MPTTLPMLDATGPAPFPARAAFPAPISRQESFAEVIARAHHRPGRDPASQTPGERARSAAEQLVAIALVQPILARARASSGAAAPFAPSEAERRMGSLLDAELAQRVTRSARFELVGALAERLAQHAGAGQSGATLTQGGGS